MTPPNKETRVLVVDDHPLLREGIKAVLDNQNDFLVCGEAEDAKSALSLIESTRPDIVILDLVLKGSDGFEVLKQARELSTEVKVLVFSGRDESVYGPRVLRAGASGYFPKVDSLDKLPVALRKVAKGEKYLSERLETQFSKPAKPEPGDSSLEMLSNRELEVFTWYGRGLASREIGKELNLSARTIESHRAHIKTKLNLKTSGEFTHFAVKWVQANCK